MGCSDWGIPSREKEGRKREAEMQELLTQIGRARVSTMDVETLMFLIFLKYHKNQYTSRPISVEELHQLRAIALKLCA